MRKIKAIVYGVGAMGRVMTRLMVEKGVDIVAAIDINPDIVGKDLGEVARLGYPLNVRINHNADAVLSEQQADIALLALLTDVESMYPHCKRCLENGVNVLTTAEELFYSWHVSPELTAKLDKLGKEHGVTMTGCGYQDTYLLHMISALAGTCHRIESINGKTWWDVDDYGPVVADYYHVGKTKDEFYRLVREEGAEPVVRNCPECLAAALGLTIRKREMRLEPVTEDVDLECKALGITVKKGLVTGEAELTEIATEQGVRIRLEAGGRLYHAGQTDINEWFIQGEPDVYVKNDNVAIRMTTCTQMVNRIPDVLNAEPGYVTVERLPALKYRPYPLNYYLDRG
jgi:hypothetical protein